MTVGKHCFTATLTVSRIERCSNEFSPWDPQRVLAMARERSERGAWMRDVSLHGSYVEREGLVSSMNHTQWCETVDAMLKLCGIPPGFRMKLIWSEELWPADSWDCNWATHTYSRQQMEWLEIQPDLRQEEIIAALLTIGTPFSIEEGHIRILGWLRPGMSPGFVRRRPPDT